jgi:hypothetical protein
VVPQRELPAGFGVDLEPAGTWDVLWEASSLSRTRRWAIAGSVVRNALAMSAVARWAMLSAPWNRQATTGLSYQYPSD